MVERLNKRSKRSDLYQNIFFEVNFSNDMLDIFSNDDSILKRLNPFDYDEEVLELEDKLKKEFWRIVKEHLTPRQRQVIELTADGYTQMEIAKILNVNQSSIVKNLRGNCTYSKDNGKNNKSHYGGSIKKLDKIIEEDEKIQDILKKLREHRESKW